MGASVYTRYVTVDPTRVDALMSHVQSDIEIKKVKQLNTFRIEGRMTSRNYIDGLTRLFANGN